MNNPTQHRRWIHGICRRAAGAAVALAVVLVPTVLATGSAQAQTFTTLHSFDGTDGSEPYAGLVQGTNGDLYGTTLYGGPNSCTYPGIGTIFSCGTVFKITPSGTLATLYNFCSQSGCTDGQFPEAGLIQGSDGNFYGTTSFGGANGDGTVFRITPSGTLTTLHSFDGTDGAAVYGGLVQGSDGNFYGTTFGGPANGTVFKITPSGTLTTLYTFCFSCTGANPYAGLVQGTDGNFYGTTFYGGANGVGTVFEITPGGTLTTLYSFCSQSGCTDGANPYAGLVQGTDGNFYGTTSGGSANGTVFKMTPSGTLTTLYTFCFGCTGVSPYAGLVQATDGNFYGTTEGGTNHDGTLFKITPSGTLTTLHSFDGTDGAAVYAGLVQGTDGNFYGTTAQGGASGNCSGGCGTVFSLAVGLGPFVETLPTSGKVGKTVKILGNNLTGTTSVSFNGTAATFTAKSTEIKTTVPPGATTGKVEVTTPKKTLKSNVAFRVTPQILSFTPTSGPVGTAVTITGVSLTQTTKVTFGGVKATAFTVDSDTQVTATVPTGAPTGKIKITTAGGTATSAASFTVTTS